MKNKFVFISIAALFLGACSGNQNKEQNNPDETHLHEEGSTHQNHDAIDTVKQEEFNATTDTIQNQIDSNQHSHDGHDHPHQH
jgi:outer membrane biogenesis lipoprotein LolB